MEYYTFEELKKKDKKLNKKKLIQVVVGIVIVIAFLILSAFYIANEDFRSWVDLTIFRKEVTENTGVIIEQDLDQNTYLYAYDQYILVLSKNNLAHYMSSGKKEFDIEVNISNPIFQSNGKYLCLAQKGGNKLYLISGQNIIWQKDVEGQISQVSVNKNGYVSIVLLGTSDKSIVTTYSPEGKKLSIAYFAKTYAIDTDISSDNKYLAIAEINSTGNLIQSSIKIISLEDVQKRRNKFYKIYL